MQMVTRKTNVLLGKENFAAMAFSIYVFGFYFQLTFSEFLNLPSLSVLYRGFSLGLLFVVLLRNCKSSISKTEILSCILFYIVVAFYIFSILRGMYSLYSFGTDPLVISVQLIFSVCIFMMVICVENINIRLFIKFSFYLNILTLLIVIMINGLNVFSLLGRLRTEALNPISISILILFNLAVTPLIFKELFLFRQIIKLKFLILTYLSFSKGPILGYLVFLLTKHKVLFVAVPIALVIALNTGVLDGQINSESTNTRLVLYESSIAQIDEHALFGKVPENTLFNYAPHNIILELFLSTGIFGTTLFLVLILFVLFITLRQNTKDEFTAAVNALFYISFIVSLFSGAFYMQHILFFSIALIIRRQFSRFR